MSSVENDEPVSRGSGNSNSHNDRVRRILLYGAVLLVVFLAGLVPMWMTARERARERDTAQATLRVTTLQNTLASAVIDARGGEYEPARQAASDFFTTLGAEMRREQDSVFNEAQRNVLGPMFDKRDETITLLARSDPASVDRLVDLYNTYRHATANPPPQ